MKVTGKPRSGIVRALDVVALLLFVVGAALYAWSWVKLRGVESYVPPEDAEPFATVAYAYSVSQLGQLGLLLTGLGLLVAIAAAILLRRQSAGGRSGGDGPTGREPDGA